MRRLAVLFGGAAVWLFLLAIPAFADGGPHVATVNNGTGTYSGSNSAGVLTSDNCAGCHRAHTAQAFDITRQEVPALCITCHGGASLGATTDVLDGIQYTAATAGQFGGTSTILGALRAGGFVNARIDSSDPGRVSYPRWDSTKGVWTASFTGNVKPLSGGSLVTSRHMNVSALALKTVWGSGPLATSGSTPGATLQLNCTSCHNPHGNGNYRILNPVPTSDESLGTFVPPTTGVSVKDGTVPTGSGLGENTRNYTVIQDYNTTTKVNTLLTVAAVLTAFPTGSDTKGDYFHKYVPWYRSATYSTPGVAGGTWAWTVNAPVAPATTSSVSGGGSDNPTGLVYSGNIYAPAGKSLTIKDSFGAEMSLWCAQCHQRYHTGLSPSPNMPGGTNDPGGTPAPGTPGTAISQQDPSGDTNFDYRHGTVSNGCTICHVAHGSNALMPGTNSKAELYPDGSTPTQLVSGQGDSRLLKVDNRGTCQLCHDPTGTVPAGFSGTGTSTGAATGTYSGPAIPYYTSP